MAATPYLADTNILLRLNKSNDPNFSPIRGAVRTLSVRGYRLCYTPQNIIEFWNVCTRPSERNGYGLSIIDTEQRIRRIERAFTLLPDNARIYDEWRRLVLTHSVSGVQVHDTHLIAAMVVHGVGYLLTLNKRDFIRYPGITVEHPLDVV
jgi:predicted nucleic acid-binding protein